MSGQATEQRRNSCFLIDLLSPLTCTDSSTSEDNSKIISLSRLVTFENDNAVLNYAFGRKSYWVQCCPWAVDQTLLVSLFFLILFCSPCVQHQFLGVLLRVALLSYFIVPTLHDSLSFVSYSAALSFAVFAVSLPIINPETRYLVLINSWLFAICHSLQKRKLHLESFWTIHYAANRRGNGGQGVEGRHSRTFHYKAFTSVEQMPYWVLLTNGSLLREQPCTLSPPMPFLMWVRGE